MAVFRIEKTRDYCGVPVSAKFCNDCTYNEGNSFCEGGKTNVYGVTQIIAVGKRAPVQGGAKAAGGLLISLHQKGSRDTLQTGNIAFWNIQNAKHLFDKRCMVQASVKVV